MFEFFKQAYFLRKHNECCRLLLLIFDVLVLAEYFLHYLEPVFLGIAIEGAIKKDFYGLWIYAVYSLVVFVVQVMRGFIGSRRILPSVIHHLRERGFKTSLSRDTYAHDEVERLFGLIDDVAVFYSALPASYVGIAAGMVFAAGYMILKSYEVFLISLLAMTVMIISNRSREKKLPAATEKFTNEQVRTFALVQDIFGGAEDIKIFCAFKTAMSWFELQVRKLKEASRDVAKKDFLHVVYDVSLPALNAFAMTLVGFYVSSGKMTVADSVSLFFYIEMFSIASETLSWYFSYFSWVATRTKMFIKEYWSDGDV